MYRIYLIKRPGVYLLATSVEGAFVVMFTSNSCTAAVIMLFLAAATALRLNLNSHSVSVSLFAI